MIEVAALERRKLAGKGYIDWYSSIIPNSVKSNCGWDAMYAWSNPPQSFWRDCPLS